MGMPFKVIAPDIDEKTYFKRPHNIVKKLALKKALKVSEKYPHNIVIGADTLVMCKGRIIGKPANYKQALEILKLENGRRQSVYTGLALVLKSKSLILADYEKSDCKARKLNDTELKKLAKKHSDKAGAYAVQDTGDPFIEKIIGSYDNVVGFPVTLFKKMLKQAGFKFI